MIFTEIVKSGKHAFKITRNIMMRDETIVSHTYKIGGEYADCITIAYVYKNNKPVQAKIPHLLYGVVPTPLMASMLPLSTPSGVLNFGTCLTEPECSLGAFLEKGSGTEHIIKTSIRYAHNDVPSVTKFLFDDDSHIDCVEKDMGKAPPRKPTRPLNLAFFYIAYHGKTWYEARFNAKMVDDNKYRKYKESLGFLTDPARKVTFMQFLEIIGISLESESQVKSLETYYKKGTTYRDFFEAVEKKNRCAVLYGWLNTFMEHYIGATFSDKGWFIDVETMDQGESQQGGGTTSRIMKYRIFSHKKMSNF